MITSRQRRSEMHRLQQSICQENWPVPEKHCKSVLISAKRKKIPESGCHELVNTSEWFGLRHDRVTECRMLARGRMDGTGVEQSPGNKKEELMVKSAKGPFESPTINARVFSLRRVPSFLTVALSPLRDVDNGVAVFVRPRSIAPPIVPMKKQKHNLYRRKGRGDAIVPATMDRKGYVNRDELPWLMRIISVLFW